MTLPVKTVILLEYIGEEPTPDLQALEDHLKDLLHEVLDEYTIVDIEIEED